MSKSLLFMEVSLSLSLILAVLLCSCAEREREYEVSDTDIKHIKTLLSDTSNPELAEIEFLKTNTQSNLAPNYEEARLAKNDKIIWTFWNMGYDQLPDFYKLNILTWRTVLGPTWKIRVINLLENDPLNASKWLDPTVDLPKNFNTEKFLEEAKKVANPAVFQSDMIRLGLLRKYGGIWMDVSNILLSDIGPCWSELIAGRKMLCGYYNEGFSTKASGYRSGFENWFIASSANNELIRRWFNNFKAFWDNHSNPKDSRTAQEFKGIDISPFGIDESGWDWTSYLTQHVAFLASVSDVRGLELLHHQVYYKRDYTEARGYFDWGGKVYNNFMGSFNPKFVDWIFSRQSIIKFAAIDFKPVDVKINEFLSKTPRNLTEIYVSLILRGKRGVPW